MSKKIQLTIPKPCHEDWNAMTPVEKGKFCGSCQKQVVDFSTMSDRQVAEFFKKPSTGSVCGRFMTDQLDREIDIPKKRIPWLKYFFGMALPAFIVSLKSSASRMQGKIKVENIQSDTTRKPVYDDIRVLGMVSRPQKIQPFIKDTIVDPVREPVSVQPDPVCNDPLMGKPSVVTSIKGEVAPAVVTDKKMVKRKVVNEKGEPVAFASIETGNGIIIADENGYFSVPKSQAGRKEGIVISSAGYATRVLIPGNDDTLAEELTIVLKANIILPEVVLVAYGEISCRRTKGQVITVMGGVRRGIKIKEDPENKILPTMRPVVRSFHVFPNPVVSGSDLSIEWKQIEEGYYSLQLINPAGQPVHQREIWIDADARLLNLDIPAMPAGGYFLVITSKKTGKRITEKLVVQ